MNTNEKLKENYRTTNRYNFDDVVIVGSTFVAKQLLHDGDIMVDLNIRKDTNNRKIDFYFIKTENVIKRIEEERIQKINYLFNQNKNSIKS